MHIPLVTSSNNNIQGYLGLSNFEDSHSQSSHNRRLPLQTEYPKRFALQCSFDSEANATPKIIYLESFSMHFASLHRHHLTPYHQNQASTSPLAFLDDPFRSHSSTFLFFSTIVLAAALVFQLMRHHYHRARKYSGGCPSCAQFRKALDPAAKSDFLSDMSLDYDEVESAKSQWAWSNGATPGSELCTEDSLGMRKGSDHNEGLGLRGAPTFYTPLTRSAMKSGGYPEAYCDVHTPGKENMVIRDASSIDVELNKARMEQSERNRLPSWPATLQKVVVGEVKEGMIAKRRRSTLGRLG